MTVSFLPSRRAIRVLPRSRRANSWKIAVGNTSPLSTRTSMIRGFLLISVLLTIALIAIFGFRGQKSTGSPLEVFPDMVRQMKVRAQAPLKFFSDGRGPRLPVADTVPIGYEMPRPQPG